jgi:uncharacterized protein YbaR (Trm112 family)
MSCHGLRRPVSFRCQRGPRSSPLAGRITHGSSTATATHSSSGPETGQRPPVGAIFHQAYADRVLLRNSWAANRELLHHSVEWKGQLSVRVEGTSAADQTAELDIERTVPALGELDRRGALKPQPESLAEVLRCPSWGASPSVASDPLSCSGCGRSYPIVGHVPVLLVEAAR